MHLLWLYCVSFLCYGETGSLGSLLSATTPPCCETVESVRQIAQTISLEICQVCLSMSVCPEAMFEHLWAPQFSSHPQVKKVLSPRHASFQGNTTRRTAFPRAPQRGRFILDLLKTKTHWEKYHKSSPNKWWVIPKNGTYTKKKLQTHSPRCSERMEHEQPANWNTTWHQKRRLGLVLLRPLRAYRRPKDEKKKSDVDGSFLSYNECFDMLDML